MVIDEEWFDDMNLTSDATFPPSLIKRAKTRVNLKKLRRDTKQRIREIAIKNGWNTHIFQILHEIREEKLFSK